MIPNEGELFYGTVQDGNDFWNATFFCGSCAVLRRSALDEIGGIAIETVTEDAHTSLRMQMNGWNTAYINIPPAAGLATECLSGHVKQRIRWARGMIQILRTDNPLFARGLKPAQRLCYFNAMSHFLYALPRLIFLTAPLIYLLLGHTNVPGYWAAILAYAFPTSFSRASPIPASRASIGTLSGTKSTRPSWRPISSFRPCSPSSILSSQQLQRHRQGRRRQQGLLRHPHRPALSAHAGSQRLRSPPGDPARLLRPAPAPPRSLRWRPPRHHRHESPLGSLQHGRHRRRHRRRLGRPAATPDRPRQNESPGPRRVRQRHLHLRCHR